MSIHKEVEYETFIIWAATPDFEREPKTQKDLAAELHVSEVTLSNWRDRDDFDERRMRHIKKWGKDRTRNVLDGLYNNAKNKGEAAEAKLWLQYMEEFNEKQEIAHSGKIEGDAPPEIDLDVLAEKVATELKKKKTK